VKAILAEFDGCRRICAGGVAGGRGVGKHLEPLRGAGGATGSVHEAHRRGAAQPGWRPPPGGAARRASDGQVPAPHTQAPLTRSLKPAHPEAVHL
jgi:hypothetical protein